METLERIERLRAGDLSQREIIVQENVGLVWNVAKKFYHRLEPEDAFQIGSIGLLKAIDKFDSSFGVQFSTYAVPLIFGEIRRFLRDDGIIKVSRILKENNLKILKFRAEYSQKHGFEPKISMISKALGLNAQEITDATDANISCDFISHNLYDGEGTSELETKASSENIEDEVLNKVIIKEMLGNLEPEERQVIMLRFFSEETQSIVGKKLGLSQVQVSRVEKRVLKKLKNLMRPA
ncbi:sigma-70 family RNA polymerase sigma factor [Treponema sp. R6D11]